MIQHPDDRSSETAETEWQRHGWEAQTQTLLDSFHRLVGRDLLPRTGDPADEAKRLFQAPFVVVSHGTEVDPVLNYGNRTALQLWEMTSEQFVVTPSRLTAESTHREARERLLEATMRQGYVDGYEGIRVSATGRRFLIQNGIIWNLTDCEGRRLGQAATFDRWTFLD
ncbi:MAG: MEKHLA domain-containing protein [Methylacidiphilales bacterium]|nr:MEKHLA domain-containing protein [Candidatus Methylacidiphilales bacterium]